MTDEEYRGRGLNRKIMEDILDEYAGKVDGIYLFGNDDVVNYYPKFGFVPCDEYEYYFPCTKELEVTPYTMEKVDMSDEVQAKKVYEVMEKYFVEPEVKNENVMMYMSENINLYHFWMDSVYRDSIYYLPECDAYIVCGVEDGKLYIYQVIGKNKVEPKRAAKAFDGAFSEVVLGYTPVDKEGLFIRIHKEEDCTLFIMGDELKCVKDKQLMFPILSHA